MRLHYPEVGFAPAPPPPGAERASEIIPTHLLRGLGGFTCRRPAGLARGRGFTGSPRAGDWGAGWTCGDPGAAALALARGSRRSSAFFAEAGAAGCAGGRASGPAGLRVFALARSCTPFLRLYPRSGHQDENSEGNRPWICSVCRNPTLNATRGRVSASHGCRVGRNGQQASRLLPQFSHSGFWGRCGKP